MFSSFKKRAALLGSTKHSHPLYRNYRAGGWMCDSCKAHPCFDRTGKGNRFSCSTGCDFDLCIRCFEASAVKSNEGVCAHPPSQTVAFLDPKHQHKLQKFNGTSPPWCCDVCKKRDPSERFSCIYSCDYDLCRECLTPASEQGKISPFHEHSLSISFQNGLWKCDHCYGSSMKRYKCTKGCDFDLCSSCVANTPPKVEQTPNSLVHRSTQHQHDLIRFEARQNWKCDDCMVISNVPTRLRCNEGCDFDLCLSCFAATSQKREIVKPIERKVETKVFVKDTPAVTPILPNEETKGTKEMKEEKEMKKESVESEVAECSICFYELKARFALVPCGHASACEECSAMMKKCPFCNQNVNSYIKLFL